MTSQNVIRNILGGFLSAYGFVAFFCFLFLVGRWAQSAPTTPDTIHGLIFPHDEHGSITYFSAFQGTSCALLFETSIPLSFLGIVISPRKKISVKRGLLGFSANWEPDDPGAWQTPAQVLGAVAAPLIVFVLGPSVIQWLNGIGFVTGF